MSPLPCSLPVVDDIETPTKVKSPTQSSHSDNVSCLSMDGDGARKKRKLQKGKSVITIMRLKNLYESVSKTCSLYVVS